MRIIVIALALCAALCLQSSRAQMGITFFPGPGMLAGSAPTCSPGGPTGQMDFSVCSNVGITAALW